MMRPWALLLSLLPHLAFTLSLHVDVPLAHNESVRIAIAPRAVATRPDGFVSFNIDFDNRPSQPQAAVFTANFSDERLLALTKALAPAALRISGGSSSKAVYGVDRHYAPSNCSSVYDPWSSRNASKRQCLLVTDSKWSEIYAFAQVTGSRLVFGFNIVYGECCKGHCTGHCADDCASANATCQSWDPSNTFAMLQHMKDSGQVPTHAYVRTYMHACMHACMHT